MKVPTRSLRRLWLAIVFSCISLVSGAQVLPPSPTEDALDDRFVSEQALKDGLLQMLARFTEYMKNDFQLCVEPNAVGEACGCFKSNSTMQSNEDGVRSNADLGMVCAFLLKYGQGKVTLPDGVTWQDIEEMSMKSFIFAYSTHKALRLKPCAGGRYWGSVSEKDHVWESSLWAMSVAYSAFFLWDRLTETQKKYVETLLVAECNYELERDIPTGYRGDTKAEENGWEACVLAATLGLFPHHALAPQWFDRLRAFAINSYSHESDATNNTIIDPDYDTRTVAQLYRGQNLYKDYTLQNHNYFHTSYQNVVIQELGEAALALKLFQTQLHGEELWHTNALMHHNAEVQREVLNWLALSDGELAMPNGNDWSLFLYDQITSYTTNACFLKDADALLLENLAFKQIRARQQTTTDGSWLLRSDIGARRMGVEAHRVMMSWLMHDVATTKELQPTAWEDFRSRHSAARLIECQDIVRAFSRDRFTTFSWSKGLRSYTGYIAANSQDKNKIIVPYKANNTGNLLGWYVVEGRKTNARPLEAPRFKLKGDGYVMEGMLATNDSALSHRLGLYSTPGNAVIYMDRVTANDDVTLTREQGGLLAINTDELTRTSRTLYHESPATQAIECSVIQPRTPDLFVFASPWVNIDNALGVVAPRSKRMAFGDRANNNSVMTSKLYAAYDNEAREVKKGDIVGQRLIVYYSNISADETAENCRKIQNLEGRISDGFDGCWVPDPDGCYSLLIANYEDMPSCDIKDLTTTAGAPVFEAPTLVRKDVAQKCHLGSKNAHFIGNFVRCFVKGKKIIAMQEGADEHSILLWPQGRQQVEITIISDGKRYHGTAQLRAGKTYRAALSCEGAGVTVEEIGTEHQLTKEQLRNVLK